MTESKTDALEARCSAAEGGADWNDSIRTYQLAEFRKDILHGLRQSRKSLPCKYLYDAHGSYLFDQICELDEYYLTRAELRIMRDNSAAIAAQLDSNVMLVEFGSGSSIKTQVLLESLHDLVAYVPVDISRTHLLKTADGLRLKFPKVEVLPVIADFTEAFALPSPSRPYSHKAIYFPGSTIGNFTPEQASELLARMAASLGPQGGLLIGIDLQKDTKVIEAAYNDARGVTSEFILNLLTRINRELDGDFQLRQFAHKAVYDDVAHRIEISIVSQLEQTVTIGGEAFHFGAGEEILAEYSHKYSVDGFSRMAAQHSFSLHQHWTDDKQLFGVLHLVLGEA